MDSNINIMVKNLKFIFFGVIVLLLNSNLLAQKSMKLFIEKSKSVLEIAEEKGNQIARAEYDNIYSSKQISWRTLHKDTEYMILAFADKNVEDLDIALYDYADGDWKKLKNDASEDSIAHIIFKPTETKEYKIEISVYKYADKKDRAKYCLLYLFK